MNKYWIVTLLAVVFGSTAGWAINYVEYGRQDAYFGEMTLDGTINAENVMERLAKGESKSAARAEVEGETTFDFGVTSPNAEGSHTFVIRNDGGEPLTLKMGATTCKCTLGKLDDEALQPGESTSVNLEWKVQTKESVFEQSAELRTNDPNRPAIRLTVKGIVIREVEFEPKQIAFGDVTATQEFEFGTNFYSYFDTPVEIIDVDFGSKTLQELAETRFEEFDPAEEGGIHHRAKQAFRITTKAKTGLRQGPLVTNMRVQFRKLDADGNRVNDDVFNSTVEVAGRVIGSITMIENLKLRETAKGGGYIWTLGRLDRDASLDFKAFVALKGSQREGTILTIGEVYPDQVVSAELDAPMTKGTMTLYQLKLKLQPSDEMIDLLGKNKDDFGWVWIESDNPKVPRMRVAIKVLLEPRS
ncbi:MAG: DUF1573 domain-containing protein [Planctomycetota bacterium]